MKQKNLQLYSIMPLDTEHIKEICEDIKTQYETGVLTCPLFKMTLVPEGNPVVNKVDVFCRQYALFQERLLRMGVPSGVLVQASIGHGWVLSEMFPYQRYTNMIDGEEVNVVCPYDEGFKDYIYNVMKTIASYQPDTIMVDDDFRLIYRPGFGCACPMHMKRFNELAKTELSREELSAVVQSGSEKGKEYFDIFVETQKEAVIETAKVMRKGIDAAAPGLPASFCCVGNNAEFAHEIATILAGENNPVIIRINNGNYCVESNKEFSNYFFKAAAQIAKLKDKTDIILAETDTCPQNRYSVGAMSLHAHFTGTILEGAKGAKHWITRFYAFEPESGRAYRNILAKWSGFYEKLAELEPELKWTGLRIPVYKDAVYVYGENFDGSREKYNGWANCVLDRFGLPMYFSAEPGGVVCLEGDMDKNFSDEEITDILKGDAFIASDTAKNLCDRGFSKYLGVTIQEHAGKTPSFEGMISSGNQMNVQVNCKELIPIDNGVQVDSVVYHSVNRVDKEELFPGTTIYQNDAGGKAFVFCGTPKAEFGLATAFSYLNSSRKQQIIRMLERTNHLQAYYPGDEEVYMRVAEMHDGKLFCAVFNIGFDPIEKLNLVVKRKVHTVEKLMPDGTMTNLNFTRVDEAYWIDSVCNTLEPVVLIIS